MHSYWSGCPSRWDQNIALKHWQPTISVALETSKQRKGLNSTAEEALNLTICETLKYQYTSYIFRIICTDTHVTNIPQNKWNYNVMLPQQSLDFLKASESSL
jgi:hypothetical protein